MVLYLRARLLLRYIFRSPRSLGRPVSSVSPPLSAPVPRSDMVPDVYAMARHADDEREADGVFEIIT